MGPKLQFTRDLSRFELHPLNRNLHSIDALKDSIARNGFMPSHPLQVVRNGGGKLRVICGHHRLAAAQELGCGVWYVEDDSSTDIFFTEAIPSTAWSMKDFACAYAKAGKEHYVELLSFCARHKIEVSIGATLLCKPKRDKKYATIVKSGEFEIANYKTAEDTLNVVTAMYEAGVTFARSIAFIRTMHRCVQIPGIDLQRLIHAAKMYPTLMRKSNEYWAIARELDRLYNYNVKHRRLSIEEGMKELLRAMREKNAIIARSKKGGK